MINSAAWYCYSRDLSGQRTKRQVASKITLCLLDLCRPDAYMRFDVDCMIGIWQWLKAEIKRLTRYSDDCTHFYHHRRETLLSGGDYHHYVHEQMSRIVLGWVHEEGRGAFDQAHPLQEEIVVPVRYYKSHAPLQFGESQLDLINEITRLEKPVRLGWSPNTCHPKANVVYGYSFVFDAKKFYWKAHYDYAKDLSSCWAVEIAPEPGQMVLDFMLNVRAWIRNGMKRKDLVGNGSKYSEWYRLKQEPSGKELKEKKA